MQDILIADKNGIEQAAAILRRGGVIGYPTETVYGLGGAATDAGAMLRIRQIKGRMQDKPMAVLIPDETFLEAIAENIPEQVRSWMRHFWPGPLTFILDAKKGLPESLTGGRGGIGVRVSSDPLCRELLACFRAPLVSTSANPSGRPPARSAGEVAVYFKGELDAIVDGGTRNTGAPSTVIDVRSRPVRLIRPGAIDISTIQSCIGDIVVPENV